VTNRSGSSGTYPLSEQAFVVLGAGAMGRIAARDLVETLPNGSRLMIADASANVASSVARSLPRHRLIDVRSAPVDAQDSRQVSSLLTRVNAFAVINATHHRFNASVMEAALRAGTHYCDLGGLFHHTRAQLRQHNAWKRADRLALLGIGAAPGIVNVLARSAADTMERVRAIHIFVAGIDRKGREGLSPFGVSYSVRTLLEEAAEPAAVLRNGRLQFEPPMSGTRQIRFPPPVGPQFPVMTLHSEIATLPLTYRDKGIRECTFRIAFPPKTVERLAFLRNLGLLSATPFRVGSDVLAPREFLASVIECGKPSRKPGAVDEYEILRVVVRGRRNGAGVEETIDCHVSGKRAWRVGIDMDTGCPPSIAMQMLARGAITGRGVLPPEQAIPAESFISELRTRGMRIRKRSRPV